LSAVGIKQTGDRHLIFFIFCVVKVKEMEHRLGSTGLKTSVLWRAVQLCILIFQSSLMCVEMLFRFCMKGRECMGTRVTWRIWDNTERGVAGVV
jgi:hypothetical protein